MLFLSEYAICLFYATYSRKRRVFGDIYIYGRLIVTCEVGREVEVAFEVSDVVVGQFPPYVKLKKESLVPSWF